jgi:hypothetical protein
MGTLILWRCNCSNACAIDHDTLLTMRATPAGPGAYTKRH